jgi:hypothetical protein
MTSPGRVEDCPELKESEGMDQETETAAQVDVVLNKVRPSLGGADIRLKEVRDGVVVVHFRKALTNSSCHVDRTRTTEEMVAEVLEGELKEIVSGFIKVLVVAE